MSFQTFHILHVDDDPVILDTVKLVLANETDNRMVVDQATSLAEARQALVDKAYDILLVDLGLDDSKGIETIEALRVYDIPMVILSGTGEQEVLMAAADAGVEDFLVKPAITSAHLVNRLRFAHARYMRRVEGEKQRELLNRMTVGKKASFNNVTFEALKPFISCADVVAGSRAPFARV